MFPAEPDSAPPSLFYSDKGVRFSDGGYTYRVYYGDDSGGGVEVMDAKGRRLSVISCDERPQVYMDYLRENLPRR